MIIQNQIFDQKLKKITTLALLAFGLIFARLVQLQIIQHQNLKQCSEKNFLRYKTIPAQRGNILDCNGIPLATNQPVTQLLWKGSGNRQLTHPQLQALERISEILHLEPDSIPLGKIRHAEKFSLEIKLANNIAPEQLCLIAEQCSDIYNIVFQTTFERFYPYNTLACHILGYLGDIALNTQGKMGLEKLFEEQLRGDPSVVLQSMNSFGTLLHSEKIKDGTCGQDLVTSIDLPLQQIVEDAMQDQIAGSCIIMEPKTGLIKALVSKPNFEPTVFSKKISHEQWQDFQEQKTFINRAFNATYPPASIFKLVTIAAALEEKLIGQNSTFTCRGYTTFKDRKYYCNKHTGHGTICTRETLAYSCNIPFFEIGKKLHIDTLASYAYEFGLGNKTNIPFSEQHGLIPTNEWKLAHKGERWWTGETLSAAIGQSFLLVTPIQIARMIGAIFHGYLVTPRITIDTPIEKQSIQIQPQTRLFLQECMKEATLIGTARRMNKIGNLTIFAKTGTAQVRTRKNSEDPETKKVNRTDKEHAWFVCYFYTDASEPLVLVMLLEHVGRSTYATNVATKLLLKYMKLHPNIA